VDKTELIRNDGSFNELKGLVGSLQERHSLNLIQLFELFSEKEVYIPATIFNDITSTLETVTKYLHENHGLGFGQIAKLLNRSEKTVWQAYSFARRKQPKRFDAKKTRYIIPVSAWRDRNLSNLEAVVLYLKDSYGLKLSEIAELLHRDQRTIWTVHSRARAKRTR
jgi:predicted DNA-binding protein (UPF0251 family)